MKWAAIRVIWRCEPEKGKVDTTAQQRAPYVQDFDSLQSQFGAVCLCYSRPHPYITQVTVHTDSHWLFIFPCVLSINQINRFISPCILSLDTRKVSGLLVYLVYWFISPCTLSLESGIVSGLLVYLVYWFISPCVLAQDSDIVSSLLVYLVYCLAEPLANSSAPISW